MKKYLSGIWFSLPIQIFLLHFRRYQVFLIFWYILFATVSGDFMESFGAYSLFLAPEYFGEVTALSTAIVGFAIGVFFMGWNITTFILHSRSLQFLATTAHPFLKYCINNALLPLSFLSFYFVHAVSYARSQELMGWAQIFWLTGGFLIGLIACIAISFMYFFGADKTIDYSMASVIKKANSTYDRVSKRKKLPETHPEIRVDWFLSTRMGLRKPRDVRHYSQDFLDTIFKRHHIAAVIAIMVAFVSLVLVGYISDSRLFLFPAAASITILFTLLIATSAAVTLFLRTWSIPVLVLLYLFANWLYQKDIIDPRNKAFGLDYGQNASRPAYDREHIMELASRAHIQEDSLRMIGVLNQWKARQLDRNPVFYIINTSGGGTRSAAFTMNTLQKLDSLFGGKLLQQTFLINGSSGGLLGAAYFRELYFEKIKGRALNLQDRKWVDNITKDLLSPIFSSFVARDLVGPVQRFTRNGFLYTKDRGYAFEQKLDQNTEHVLDKNIGDYAAAESNAMIPTMFFNSVISRDARKLLISTHPVRFLMKATLDSSRITAADPDIVDFNSMFKGAMGDSLSILSALRMNATFPYVLPNVWLPSEPVIDVMDAGLRDNFGQESSLRFIEVFKEWLQQNTSKVVLIQIRDRGLGDWDKPYDSKSLFSMVTKPFLLLQNNWYKLQDYYQYGQLDYLNNSFGDHFYRVCFQYIPQPSQAPASLSFHLTAREKKEIADAVSNTTNLKEFEKLSLIRKH